MKRIFAAVIAIMLIAVGFAGAMPLIGGVENTNISKPFDLVWINPGAGVQAPLGQVFESGTEFEAAAAVEPVIARWRIAQAPISYFGIGAIVTMQSTSGIPNLGVTASFGDLLKVGVLYDAEAEKGNLYFASEGAMQSVFNFFRWTAKKVGV